MVSCLCELTIVRTGGTLSFLLGDHLGSSSVTTNASGVKTASALYKAFGETRYTLGALGTDYKFTGQREQAELGLYFYGARWFDPSLGRFTSPDTIVPTGTQGTQAWDRYAYVNNNPVRYTDPTGHQITGEKCGLDDCESWGSAGSTDEGGGSGDGGGGGGGKPKNSHQDTQESDTPPLCEDVSPGCESLFEGTLSYDQLGQMRDLLNNYINDVEGLQWKVGAIGVIALLLGLPVATAIAAGLEVELSWEKNDASTMITYLENVMETIGEDGSVNVTFFNDKEFYAGYPVVFYAKGMDGIDMPGITSPGLLYVFSDPLH